MSAQDAIQHDLRHFYIYDYKACIYKEVEYGRGDPFEHFFLPESPDHHVLKPFIRVVAQVFRLTQLDISVYTLGFFKEQVTGSNQ